MSEHKANKPSKEKQIKSQQRVADFGEFLLLRKKRRQLNEFFYY